MPGAYSPLSPEASPQERKADFIGRNCYRLQVDLVDIQVFLQIAECLVNHFIKILHLFIYVEVVIHIPNHKFRMCALMIFDEQFSHLWLRSDQGVLRTDGNK